MKAGSMEGLIGAGVNLKMTETPMRVYREAEREGDTAKMERAMGYAADFQGKAYEYSDKAQEELAKELEAEETAKVQNDEKVLEKIPVPHDEYISSEKSDAKPSGLYWVGQDENGNPKVLYDDPKKAGSADGNGQPKVKSGNPGKAPEKCTGSTDKVDREIKKLKEKKKELEQQIKSASGDEKKVRELEKKLAQVESELSQKDNDAYRREHSTFSE